jgi:hypothetical protein
VAGQRDQGRGVGSKHVNWKGDPPPGGVVGCEPPSTQATHRKSSADLPLYHCILQVRWLRRRPRRIPSVENMHGYRLAAESVRTTRLKVRKHMDRSGPPRPEPPGAATRRGRLDVRSTGVGGPETAGGVLLRESGISCSQNAYEHVHSTVYKHTANSIGVCRSF